jgi:glucokinase
MTTILAGDVGGTKSNLGLLLKEGPTLRLVFQRRVATRDYSGFENLIDDFLEHAKGQAEVTPEPTVDAAAFGVAGVVAGGQLHAENLPWRLDFSALQRKFKLKTVTLLNDVIATALSLDRLSVSDFVVLNEGSPEPNATKGVIAAGTGLGEAILFWDGERYRVARSEGGQGDFSPRTEREIELLKYLKPRLAHVSWEEVVSGRGFRRIHEFLDSSVRHQSFETPAANTASEITQLGLGKSCPVCAETLSLWIELYGVVAGNFALQAMALGGLFIAGGIAVKILPRLKDGIFFRAFCGTGKLASVLSRIPISVVVNEDAPMWGAAYQAVSNSEGRS